MFGFVLTKNAVIALVVAALIGAGIAVVTVHVVTDTSQPPVWMQKDKARVDAIRNKFYGLDKRG